MSVPSPNNFTTPSAAPPNQHSVAPVFAPPAVAAEASAQVSDERGAWWRDLSPLGRWSVGGAGVLLGLAVIAGGVASGMYISWRGANRIAPNVSIQGVPVGDMTAAQAKAALKKKYGALQVRFETPEKVYTQNLAQMGGRVTIDQAVRNAFWLGRSGSLPANMLAVYKARSEPTAIPLALKWDKKALRSRMSLISSQYAQAPTDARLQFAGSDLAVVPDAPGRAINAGATLASLQQEYKIGHDRIVATVMPVPARITASALEGRNVLLGTYSTSFDSGLWGRTRNLHVAASTIDGMVMMPGEKFSFNQRTGERTWDKGYRMGHIFEDRGKGAEVVDGLAGGVCQVSSTIFNAVRKTNNKLPSKVFLRINERNHHSLPVSYVPSGLDATVAWPHKDFRFTNTLSHPIFLRAVISGGTLSVSVWGRIPDSSPGYTTQLAQVSTATS
jgi:vancomycin resistance protein YoaR